MGISKNGGNWHLEAFLCYFTCLNLIFVKILGNFQLSHHYYCLTVTGHVFATTSSNEYAKQPTLDFTIHDDTGRNIFSFQRTFFFIKYSRNRVVHDTKQRLNHLNLNTSMKKMAKNIVIVILRGNLVEIRIPKKFSVCSSS